MYNYMLAEEMMKGYGKATFGRRFLGDSYFLGFKDLSTPMGEESRDQIKDGSLNGENEKLHKPSTSHRKKM